MSLLNLVPRLDRQRLRIASTYLDADPNDLLQQIRSEALTAAREELETSERSRVETQERVTEVTREVSLPDVEQNLKDARVELRAAQADYDPDRFLETWPRVKLARQQVELLEALESLSG